MSDTILVCLDPFVIKQVIPDTLLFLFQSFCYQINHARHAIVTVRVRLFSNISRHAIVNVSISLLSNLSCHTCYCSVRYPFVIK